MWTDNAESPNVAVYLEHGDPSFYFSPMTNAADTLNMLAKIQEGGYIIRMWSPGWEPHYISGIYKGVINRNVPTGGWVAAFWRYENKDTGEVVNPHEQRLYIDEEVGYTEGAPTFEEAACIAALRTAGIEICLDDVERWEVPA